MRRLATALLALALAGCGRGALVAPQMATFAAHVSAIAPSATMQDFMRETFRIADLRHDGALTADELGLSATQFEALDTNHDGKLTADELFAPASPAKLKAVMPAFEPLVDRTFALLDRRHVGRVTPADIQAVLGESHEPLMLKLNGAFHQADRRGDAALDRAEFEDFYANLGRDPQLETGIFGDIGQSVLGAYLYVTGHIAANKAIHPPRDHNPAQPSDLGLPFDSVTMQAADGTPLAGWYVPAAVPSTKTVVLVHGYQCAKELWVGQKVLPMLHDRYNCVCVDLRNCGYSGGTVTSFGYYEAQDVEAAIAFARSRGATSIGVIGQSLGAATSIKAVAQTPGVKALVSDCAFATIQSAFAGAIASTWVPQPALVADAAIAIANQTLGCDMTSTEPITQLAALAPRPLLIVHGADDPYIDPSNANILFDAYQGPKTLWLCPGAHHGDSDTTQPDVWKAKVRALLDAAL